MERRKTYITDYLFYISIILAPMMMFSIMHVQAYLWMALIATIIVGIKNNKLFISNDLLLNLMLAEMFISAFLALFSNIPKSYKKNGFVNLFMIVIVYLFSRCASSSLKNRDRLFLLFYKAIRWMILLELIWCVIQSVCYVIWGIDINQIIFVDTLHLTEVASAYRASNHQFRPSGLAHHPAIMAPLITIGFFMFDSPYIKMLCLVVAVICENTTALIAGILCCVIMFFMTLYKMKKNGKITKNRFIIILTFVAITFIILFTSGGLEYFVNKTLELFIRLTKNNGTGEYSLDSSSLTHKRYYTELYRVIKNNTLIQNIFGYGPGNSGFGISRELGQYVDKGSWTVESDLVDKFLSYGVVGFVIQYTLLLKISIYAYKKNSNYVCLFILLLEGITYNVQFTWVLLLELLIYFFLKQGFDIMPKSVKNRTLEIGKNDDEGMVYGGFNNVQ